MWSNHIIVMWSIENSYYWILQLIIDTNKKRLCLSGDVCICSRRPLPHSSWLRPSKPKSRPRRPPLRLEHEAAGSTRFHVWTQKQNWKFSNPLQKSTQKNDCQKKTVCYPLLFCHWMISRLFFLRHINRCSGSMRVSYSTGGRCDSFAKHVLCKVIQIEILLKLL